MRRKKEIEDRVRYLAGKYQRVLRQLWVTDPEDVRDSLNLELERIFSELNALRWVLLSDNTPEEGTE